MMLKTAVTVALRSAMARFVFGMVLAGTMVPANVAAQEEDGIPPLRWELTQFVDSQFGPTVIDAPELYTVQFLDDGTLAVRADCNQALGDYSIMGSALDISPMVTTLVHCGDDSYGAKFLDEMNAVTSFVIDQEGTSDELVLGLMADGGLLHFRPALSGVVWEWQMFQGEDDSEVAPDNPSRYTIELLPDGTIQAQVDCNRGTGSFESDGVSIDIELATTRIACGPDSFDAEFSQYLTEASSYVIREGMLHLALPADAGIATFAPVIEMQGDNGTPEAG